MFFDSGNEYKVRERGAQHSMAVGEGLSIRRLELHRRDWLLEVSRPSAGMWYYVAAFEGGGVRSNEIRVPGSPFEY